MVPEFDIGQIRELRTHIAPTMLGVLEKNELDATDPAGNLRNAAIAIVMTLYVRGEVTKDEFGIADLIHYHLTGETVQQRIESASTQSDDHDCDLEATK